MIELTVKTLDSQNHAFTVDDDMTVAQFKEKIADTVNIPADTQRIIYCGRVLQDSSKLNDYDVNGKVVHLVQRPPPSANQRPNQQSESPPAQPQMHRRIRGLEYLGSLRLPNDPEVMPPLIPLSLPSTHSLAASRLNIARRMLRRAEAVLNTLENPSARPADQSTQEGQTEITPVFEARVIVPNIPSNESLNEAAVISAVNSLMNSALPLNGTQTTASPNVQVQLTDSLPQNANDVDAIHSVSSTPEVTSPLATSSENLTAQDEEQTNGTSNEDEATSNANNTTNATNSNDTISRTSEYAELLDNLNRIHARFTPFLEEYYNFMRDDPAVPSESARAVQGMINRVSEILHLLGHAYHSLSDIIVRVRTPPPRPLLCRPILIQQSAIVQAGIPIQVEAQINFSSDRNGNANRAATTQPSTTNGNQTSTTTTTTSNIGTTIMTQLPSRVSSFPLIPGAGVRVETYHIPQTASMSMENSGGTGNNNNRDTPVATPGIPNLVQVTASNNNINNGTGISFTNSNIGGESTTADPTNLPNVYITSSLVNNVGGNSTSEANQQVTNSTTSTTTPQVTINNPVEFFMEVTPESITIDSLETAFVGSNQANEILQGALNPPPELIQSIMHMAGQLINRGAQSATVVSASAVPSAPQSEGSATDAQATVTTNSGAVRAITFQNSQARGNTQTQPTTVTHTRSTARPHVHLAQHAMQGFDPFLPCNSHHVTRRRVAPTSTIPQTAQQPQGNATTTQPNGEGSNEARNADQTNPLYNIMRSIINTVHHAYTNQQTTQQTPTAPTTTTAAPSNASAPIPSVTPLWMPTLENMNLSDTSFLRTPAPTIAQLLQQFSDESYNEGESIFTDLIMLLSRNLTISDVIQINSGRLEPLMRIRNQLRNFFLYRILDGCQGSAAIDRGVDRLLNEFQPLLDHLSALETRDDIDIVRSVQTLLRARLPNIISLVASRSSNSLKMVVDQIRTTGRQFCALALRASQNGRQGVENIFDLILSRYMEGIPRDLQHWTLMTSRAHMMIVLSSLDVPESILQPYIVREVDAVTPSLVNEPVTSQETNASNQVELMQVDEGVVVSVSQPEEQTLPPINLADDTEPLPQVIYGSESWHGQVPSDWVPIIARDSQRQRRQNSQPPFSDAYLSGMPSKRRKIVTNSKPQGSLPQVITDSVRRAVTATGLTGVAPLETVAAAAGADLNIQSAYRNLLRSSVQSGLSNNEDFTPERFPNANNYFNNYPQ
ncbi:hypothetical protein RN001_009843 [Aquatica leii]|uniref:Large proline-rich protein BAG6 n=1 Tax=Aquatica leii TaxID=1421715 RepID=A0AAN7SE36_9COLE|nr:hypothetical protein RN001_009843 [Aquatica leii]